MTVPRKARNSRSTYYSLGYSAPYKFQLLSSSTTQNNHVILIFLSIGGNHLSRALPYTNNDIPDIFRAEGSVHNLLHFLFRLFDDFRIDIFVHIEGNAQSF